MSTTTTPPSPSDPTFRSYTVDQARYYGSWCLSYESEIYDTVLNHYVAIGGQFSLLLDCGCGPGNATRDLALSFDQVIGTDAGAAMIKAARELGGKTKSGGDIRFKISPAEEFPHVKGLEGESVDLITVAMAVGWIYGCWNGRLSVLQAHWFEMDNFWAEAAKILKPGGTVAICTRGGCFEFFLYVIYRR